MNVEEKVSVFTTNEKVFAENVTEVKCANMQDENMNVYHVKGILYASTDGEKIDVLSAEQGCVHLVDYI